MRHLRADGQQNAQMIGGEGVRLSLVKSQHADHAGDALQRNRQRGTQGAELAWDRSDIPARPTDCR